MDPLIKTKSFRLKFLRSCLNPQGRGNKSLPRQPSTAEDAASVARPARRAMAPARRPPVPCPAVHGGPLAPASHHQVDASPRQAGGVRDLCASSTAPGGRARPAWTAALTLSRVVDVHGGRAYGVRARGAQRGRRRRRLGQPAPGRRATGGGREPGPGVGDPWSCSGAACPRESRGTRKRCRTVRWGAGGKGASYLARGLPNLLTSLPLSAAAERQRCYDFRCQGSPADFLGLHPIVSRSASEKSEPAICDG
jgi:hypothetical protein